MLVLLIFGSANLTGCASWSIGGDFGCGKEMIANWKRRDAPANAQQLKSIADDNPVWTKRAGKPDRWFGSDDHLMLCRSNIWHSRPGSAEWWIFDNQAVPPTLEDNDGVLIVS